MSRTINRQAARLRTIVKCLFIVLCIFCCIFSDAQELGHAIHPIEYKLGKQTIDSLLNKAKVMVNDKPDSALLIIEDLLPYCNTEDLRYQQTKAFTFMSISYMRKGWYKQSQAFLDMAFKNANKLQDKDMLVFLHNVNAINFQQTGAYGNSISHYLQALNLIKEGVSIDRRNQTYINFGGFWSTLGENKQALKYFELTVDSNNNRLQDPYILMNMGIAYVDSSAALAIQKFNEALQAVKPTTDLYLIHKLNINLSVIYGMENQFDSAFHYLHKADSLTRILNTELALATFQAAAGSVYKDKKLYKEAAVLFNASLLLAQKLGLKEDVRDAHEKLSEVYGAMGNYERAYYHQNFSIAYQDSVQQHEKANTLDLMLDYQRVEKDRLISQKQLQLNKTESEVERRNSWIINILLVCFCMIALLIFAYRNSKNKQKFQLGELALLKQQQEIEKLQALAAGEENERNRIAHELHDSVMIKFSAVKMQLNALPAEFPVLLNTAAHQKILKQLDTATTELRRTAHNLMPDILLDEGLVQAVFYFCKNIQETSGLNILFQYVGDELPRFTMEFEIAIYRIVQELLQNVIKHSEADKALVQMTYSDHYLSLTIEDNGKGFVPEATAEGMGLRSIKNKLATFGCTFDIKSILGSNTTIYIECPISSLLLRK